MTKDERTALIALAFLLMGAGTVIAFAMPYDINSSFSWHNPVTGKYETSTTTVTVYGHPIGWAIDGIGFLILLVGLMVQPNGSTSSTQRTFHGKVCGNCFFFGKEECKRKEKMFNAMPCEDFTP